MRATALPVHARLTSTNRSVGRPVPRTVKPAAWTSLTSAVCFNEVCQANADRAFLLAVSVPVLVALGAVGYALRPLPKEELKEGKLFQDPDTGAVFQGSGGTLPERNQRGELAFRPLAYTPWPVEEGAPGERLRVPVGQVRRRQPRTFVFQKLLGPGSQVLQVSLPRPLGLVCEYDEGRKRTRIVDLVEGSYADQRRKMASMNRQLASNAVLPGDILRAVTATNFVYPTKALFGAVPPERHVVLFGADGQRWSVVRGALGKGIVADGDVTVIVERASENSTT
ncbi:hypothetical protein V8C86DRAFT_2526243 [Haematococcus lacustris]